MKILCVIDSLGSGGAQRQMVNLATGLKAKGHDVEMFIYHPQLDFFRSIVQKAGIIINEVHGVSGFSLKVIGKLTKILNQRKYDALISFLPSPNIYTIIGKILSRTHPLVIVGERASKASDPSLIRSLLQRLIYIKATRVVANSYNHAKFLSNYFWLKKKVSTIYNGYILSNNFIEKDLYNINIPNILVVGRIEAGKNGVRLIKALNLFFLRNGYALNVKWAGRQEQDHESLSVRAEMNELIVSNTYLQTSWKWIGERFDISELFAESDALIHVSLFEGLPNVVCEAFIAARPVIVSAVCDHPLLVEEGVRGHLCDPLSHESICEAIERFVSLPLEERQTMGRNARQYAEKNLTLARMVDQYEALMI